MLSVRFIGSTVLLLLAVVTLCEALVGAAPAMADAQACTGTLQLTVSDPAQGAQLPNGVYRIQGYAFDTSASQGSGVNRVQVFLDPRDQGGLLLTTAQLGQPNPAAPPNSQFATAGWSGDIDLSGRSGVHSLVVYARSAATKAETWSSIPITIGVTRPSISPLPVASKCQPGVEKTVRLVVDNPQVGALLRSSPYQLQGTAMDVNAPAGTSGVDHVQIFMGDRDKGGRLLLTDAQIAPSGAWSTTVDLTAQTGSGNIYVVAHSALNGTETAANIPVFFGAP
ncbi:MAG: hypothetical protein JO023_24635 [Chloroflexi bacterium]|nr:hypothetical protein [Chloroflexota bacterium]